MEPDVTSNENAEQLGEQQAEGTQDAVETIEEPAADQPVEAASNEPTAEVES